VTALTSGTSTTTKAQTPARTAEIMKMAQMMMEM
jgi:hypothetical protein